MAVSYGSLVLTDSSDIDNIVQYFLISSSNSGITKEDRPEQDEYWTTDESEAVVSATKRYLWCYTKYYAKGILISETEPVIIGRYAVDGINQATVYLYKRIATVAEDDLPGELIYSFTTSRVTGELNGWSQQIPTTENNDNPCYMISTVALSATETYIIAEETEETNIWTEPIIYTTNGTDGTNTATIYLYKRLSSTDSILYPNGTFRYYFTDNSLVAIDGAQLNGWTRNIPATDVGRNPCYVINATVTTNESSALITSWTDAIKFAENGYNSATVYIYKRSATIPTKPVDGTIFNFNNGSFSPPSGWSASMPEVNEYPCYVCVGTVISSTSQGTITWQQTSIAKFVEAPYYTFIKFSNGDHSQMHDTYRSGDTYIGTYSGTEQNPIYTEYVWSRYIGQSMATIYLYQRAENEPDPISETLTYDFLNGTLTSNTDPSVDLVNWKLDIGQIDEENLGWPVWITAATAITNAGEPTDTIAANEWSAPTQLGFNGASQATIFLYTHSEAQPTSMPHNLSYTFSDGTIDSAVDGESLIVALNGWSLTIPSHDPDHPNDVSWIISAAAIGSNDSVIIESNNWSSPVRFATEGPSGLGISSIETRYALGSNDTTHPVYDPTDASFETTWTLDTPIWNENTPYYWVATVIHYSDETTGQPFFYVDRALTESASLSNQTAQIATNMSQYFWYTRNGEGDVPSGVYVLPVLRSTFVNSPDDHENVSVRSDGLYLNSGLDVLGFINQSQVSFYDPNTHKIRIKLGLDSGETGNSLKFYYNAATAAQHAMVLNNDTMTFYDTNNSPSLVIGGSGYLRSGNYSLTAGARYSTNGSYIDLTNGDIITPGFRVQTTENGGIFTTNVYIKGHVEAETGTIGNWLISDLYGGALCTNGYTFGNGILISPSYTPNNAAAVGVLPVGKSWTITAGNSFGVTSSGELYAQNAVIYGTIHASAGEIGGWSIGTDDNKSLFYGSEIPGSASSDGPPLPGAPAHSLVISSNSAPNEHSIAGSGTGWRWFIAADDKFGVTTDGALYANSGKIAGWNINEGSLSYGTIDNSSTNKLYLGTTDTTNSITIGNSGSRTDWRILAGNKFGVDDEGNLYASSANISGTVNATAGTIGGVSIVNGVLNVKTIKGGTPGSNGFVYLSTDAYGSYTVNGYSYSNWRLLVSNKFGVDYDGQLVASNAIISGTITATGGTIGGCSITNGVLQVANANISGTIDVGKINLKQSLTIGSNSEFQMQLTGSAINLMYQTYLLGTITGSPAGDYMVLKSQSGSNVLYLGGGADGGVELSNGSRTIYMSDKIYLGGPVVSGYTIRGNSLHSDNSVIAEGSFYRTTAPGAHTKTYDTVWWKSDASNYHIARPSSGSSRRYKKDIMPVTDEDLDPHHIYDIDIVQFKFKQGYLVEDDEYYNDPYNMIGFIAEDVYEKYPVAVDVIDGEIETWNPRMIIPPMLALIQEQNERIKVLEEEVQALKQNYS